VAAVRGGGGTFSRLSTTQHWQGFFEVILNQLYKLSIGIGVNEVLSYLVRRDLGVNNVLPARTM
jgi:hypothetical protein